MIPMILMLIDEDNLRICGVEKMVFRRAHNPEVAGSSPATATKF